MEITPELLNILLLLQICGIFIAITDYEAILTGSAFKKYTRLFVLFIPIILYVNLLLLGYDAK